VRVELSDVTITYGATTAVKELSLTIEDGELMVLLGPSGCGKTSVMRSIVGLERPARGVIRIGDTVVFDSARGIDVPTNRRRVGMVFQSYAIWPHMTVLENVSFPLKLERGRSRAQVRDRTMEVLRTVGLDGMADRSASMLSGGQMQRVALARSIAMNPHVMLLDEPLSNLDAKMRDRLRFELKELHDRLGMTALYVTHDLSEALALGDRVAVMRDGQIVQLGRPREVYAHPSTPFVADFLGIANVFPGTAADDGDQSTSGLTVRLDGFPVSVRADDPAGAPAGGELVVCLAPEDLHLSNLANGSTDNTWRAEILVSNFLGTQTRYKLRTREGLELDVLSYLHDDHLATGDDVYVHVDAKNVRVLSAPDNGAADNG
jgi:iron(III) transport system ATP-binding protein